MASPKRKSSSIYPKLTPRKINSVLDELDESEIEDLEEEDDDDLVSTRVSIELSRLPLFDGNWSDDTDSDPDYVPDLASFTAHLPKKKRKNNTSLDEQPSTSKTKKVKKNKPVNASLSQPIKSKTRQPVNNLWIRGKFSPNSITLHQPSCIDQNCKDWDDEKYILQYIDDDFLTIIVDKSNQSFLQRIGKNLNLTLNELKTWLGINYVMAAIQMPKIRMFWEKQWRVPLVADAMVRDRFFQIRSAIKIVYDDDINAEQRKTDRLWKVRPLIDKVLQGCLKQNKSQELCVDEMMIPFSGTCSLKQYIPNKPNPVGIKVFVLANSNGIICDYIVYQGATTFPLELAKDFWQCECAVLALSKSLVPGP